MTALFVIQVSIDSDINILGLDYSVLASACKVFVELFCLRFAVCHIGTISFKWSNSLHWYFSIYLVQKYPCFAVHFSEVTIVA